MAKKTSDYGSATEITVVHSENAEGGALCIDIFRRGDDSFGFELFRRDVESGEGWFRLGTYADHRFDSPEDAANAAAEIFDWFRGP